MANAPQVTVIVPMRNAEPYIAQTLNSILQETSVSLEVVVINDKSTDRSLEKALSVGDARVRIIEGPGQGISACLNAGLDAACGDIIMRCDADDLFPAGRIRGQVGFLLENPDFAAVCGGLSTMDHTGNPVAELVPGSVAEEITDELNAGKTRTTFCAYAVRREVFGNTGGFRPYFETSEDIDFQLRLGEAGRVMFLPQSFYVYRLHDESVTHTHARARLEFYEDIARRFQSQRKLRGQDDLQLGNPPEPPDKLPETKDDASKHIQDMLTSAAWREHGEGNRLKAIRLGWRALKKSPGNSGLWKSLVALLIKPGGR